MTRAELARDVLRSLLPLHGENGLNDLLEHDATAHTCLAKWSVGMADALIDALSLDVPVAWVEWHGGERPVDDPETMVAVRLETGEECAARPARVWDWGRKEGANHIVAYRVGK